jgi:hypothetical protein
MKKERSQYFKERLDKRLKDYGIRCAPNPIKETHVHYTPDFNMPADTRPEPQYRDMPFENRKETPAVIDGGYSNKNNAWTACFRPYIRVLCGFRENQRHCPCESC